MHWLLNALEWLVLLPLWRRAFPSPALRTTAALASGAAWLLAIVLAVVLLAGDGDSDGQAAAPTPTPTTTATQQPTASPSPGPSSSPSGADLEILHDSSYTDGGGALHVVGEVRNNSAAYIEFVKVTATFFNAAGAEVYSQFTFTLTDLVAPGEAEPFDVLVVAPEELAIADYKLAVEGIETADRPPTGLTSGGDTSSVDEFDTYHVNGEVFNRSDQTYSFIQVIGTFYDSGGTVVAADFVFSKEETLAPGEASSFELRVVGGGALGIDTYRLTVDGTPGEHEAPEQ